MRILTPVVRKCWLVSVCAMLCAAGPLMAQQSWSATVIAESAPVYFDMSTSSEVMTKLPKGTVVTVYFAVRSIQGSWSKIALQNDRQPYGFVLSSQLHRDQPAAVGASASAGSGNAACTALVDELMKASGSDAAFSFMSKDVVSAISQRNTQGLGPQDYAELKTIVERELDGYVMSAGVHRGLVRRCDPANYSASLEVFQSPLVARMIKLETPPYSAAGGPDKPSAERTSLLRRLEHAEGTTQLMLDLVIDMTTATYSTVSGNAPSRAEVASMRSEADRTLRPIVMTMYALVYRSVSDADLAQYAGICESQPLRQFNTTYQSVFREVAKTQSRVIAIDMKAYMESHHPRGTTR